MGTQSVFFVEHLNKYSSVVYIIFVIISVVNTKKDRITDFFIIYRKLPEGERISLYGTAYSPRKQGLSGGEELWSFLQHTGICLRGRESALWEKLQPPRVGAVWGES